MLLILYFAIEIQFFLNLLGLLYFSEFQPISEFIPFSRVENSLKIPQR
jgi:hypothetical protein